MTSTNGCRPLFLNSKGRENQLKWNESQHVVTVVTFRGSGLLRRCWFECIRRGCLVRSVRAPRYEIGCGRFVHRLVSCAEWNEILVDTKDHKCRRGLTACQLARS